MNLAALKKTTKRSKKRVGRGYGSGKGGHTSGRGQKGQKARNSVPSYFIGAAQGSGFIKRLPLLRGKGKLKSHSHKPIGINVQYLNVLPKNTTVTQAALVKYKIIDSAYEKSPVKILGGGKITIPLVVLLPCTKGASKKITQVGGTVQSVSPVKKTPGEPLKKSARKKAPSVRGTAKK